MDSVMKWQEAYQGSMQDPNGIFTSRYLSSMHFFNKRDRTWLAGKSRTRACHIKVLVHEAATASVKNINVASL